LNRLRGKRCLVTAAGQGIGRQTALEFGSEGAQVVAIDIAPEGVHRLAGDHPTIEAKVLDACDPEAVAELVQDGKPFDVVFNCVGYVHHGTILDCGPTSWAQSFQINVDSMYLVCRAVLPGMLAQRAGSVINVASVASSVTGVPNRFAYGATKGAVIGLTKSIAADFVKQGIRCNAICPGTIDTPSLAERIRALPGDFEANWQNFVDRQPMARLGMAEEVASLAVYLASDESAFTTGALHIIDGGWTT
jgi:2-keto-3-deoxy-L-fuconate dehydrogenase